MFSAIGIQLNLALTSSTGAEQAIHTLSSKAIDQTECSSKNLKFVKWMINSQKFKRSSWKELKRPEAAVRTDHKQTKVMRKHTLWVS